MVNSVYEVLKRQEATKRSNIGCMEEVFGWGGWKAKGSLETSRGLQVPMTQAHHRVGITQSKKSPWKFIQITVIVFKEGSRRTVLVGRTHSHASYTTLKKNFWTHKKITIINSIQNYS